MERTSTSVIEIESNGMRFFATRTGAKDVVTILGSMFGGYNMLPRAQSELPGILSELLDTGTRTKSKEVIREGLAAKGISISFGAGGDRLNFSASCFPEDISFTLKTIVECISDAQFPAAEIKIAKERALGELVEEKSDTRSLASSALSRMMYDPNHVNYAETIAARKKSIEGVTRSELLKFRTMLGRGGLIVAIVGDIQPESTLTEAKKIFSKLPPGTSTAPEKTHNKKILRADIEKITLTDKANIDVYLGVPLTITYDDPLYVALSVAVQMLGGGMFSSHLTQTLRERDGLTYVVHAMLSGFQGLAEGSLRVWATFSPQRYDESVAILRKEIQLFFDSKITEERLASKKIEIAGNYLVGLSTTQGFARALHSIGTEGKSLAYLDEYPDLVDAVTVQDLKEAAKLIPLDKLSLAAAGTFQSVQK